MHAIKRIKIFVYILGQAAASEQRSNSKFDKPQDYIEYLKETDRNHLKILQCLENLRVALTNNPISWMQEFGESGVDEVVNLLRECKKRKEFDKIEYECIRCLKAIVNNTWGMNIVLKPEKHAAIFLLAQCLNPNKPQAMCEVVKLLAGFCLIQERDGNRKVLGAITQVAKSSGDRNAERFRPIVEALFVEHELEGKGIKTETKGELAYHSLILINTITNTPHDLNIRMHLRCEMMRSGLNGRLDLLAKIASKQPEKLDKHFKIFLSFKEDDYEEFSARFDHVRCEIDDINDCFEILKNLVVDTASEPYLLSTLQHLLFIRDDHEFRPAYFKLIEEVISQIVLNKNGDPNFEARDLGFDIAPLLDDLVERSKANDAKKTEEYEKKLEELQMAKQEAEAKLAHLDEKVKEYEANGVVAKSTNKLPQVNIPPPPMMPGN